MRYDVIVIGAGPAGLTAAIRHARSGRQTLLIAKGQGSLHWSSGCVDLWPGANPRAAIARLAPPHPYGLAGIAALDQALEWLIATAREAGYPLAGSAERTLHTLTAVGTWRPTALIPHSMVAAERATLMTGGALIAGFRELRDFYPPLLAARLNEQGIPARGVYLELPPTERQRDWNSMQLARCFEQAAFRESIARQVRQIRSAESIVLLPAVLGLADTPRIVAELQALIGALIGEIPTLPTNVPGVRLYRLLVAALEAAGGRIQLNAEVVRGEWSEGRLRAVWSKAAAREQRHEAGWFVLATGGVGGGGVRADYAAGLRETALDLPLTPLAAREHWFSADVGAEHAIFKCGVPANANLQPIDGDGAPIAPNLRLAGAAIQGADLIRERCVEGVALATGWRAGEIGD